MSDLPDDVFDEMARYTSGPRPEPVEPNPVYVIENGWLCLSVNEHTCGAGPGSYGGMHEPGCGLIPLADISDLLAAHERSAVKQAVHNAVAAAYKTGLADGKRNERERIERLVRDNREAFLSSHSLDPAWIAGWHAATDDHAARIARTEPGTGT